MSKRAEANQWMPLHIDAWRTKTRKSKPIERCAYMDLLMEYWDTQKPLEVNHDDFAALVGIPRAEWDEISERVLRYFEVGEDGLLHNKRIDEEIAKAKRLLKQKQEAGRRGGNAKAKRNPSSATKNSPENLADLKREASSATKNGSKNVAKPKRGSSGYVDPRVLLVPSVASDVPRVDLEVNSLLQSLEAEWFDSTENSAIRSDARKNSLRGVS